MTQFNSITTGVSNLIPIPIPIAIGIIGTIGTET